MFDHVGLFVSDPQKEFAFLEAALAPLGLRLLQRLPDINAAIFAPEQGDGFLFVGGAEGVNYYGTPVSATSTRPIHLAFRADSAAAVREFHRAGLAAGGRDNGKPEPDAEGAVHAFLLDPDGNNIEAIYRPPKVG